MDARAQDHITIQTKCVQFGEKKFIFQCFNAIIVYIIVNCIPIVYNVLLRIQVDHAAPNDPVRHIGDLGNVRSVNGVAVTKFSDQVINLHGMRSVIGRSVVVHTGTDDLGKGGHPDSKKTGNAGGRAGCGVIGIA